MNPVLDAGSTMRAPARLLAGFWLLALTDALAAEAGQRCTYSDTLGRDWNVTVASVERGVDGQPWAWVNVDADPRRVFRIPVASLRGCRGG
jgi:hypothetical protein